MIIDKVISQYLTLRGRRIIIPGLGALIKRDNGEVVFVDILTKDDGILAAEVSRSLGYTIPEAYLAVGKYSEQLHNDLVNSSSANIEGLGTITLGRDGKYGFIPSEAAIPDGVMTSAGVGASAPSNAGAQSSLPESSAQGAEVAGKQDSYMIAELPSPDAFALLEQAEELPQTHSPTEGINNQHPAQEPQGRLPKQEAVGTEAPGGENPDGQQAKPLIDYSSRIHIQKRVKRKRLDPVMIIAIIAIVIAVVVIVYGKLVENGYALDLKLPSQTENAEQ